MDAPALQAALPDSPATVQSAALGTPDHAYQMLSAALWEPVEGGWRDPDGGEVVPWWEGIRRARRRVR